MSTPVRRQSWRAPSRSLRQSRRWRNNTRNRKRLCLLRLPAARSERGLFEALLHGLLHRDVQELGLDWCNAKLQAHVLELREVDRAIAVGVELLEEVVHGFLINGRVRPTVLARRGQLLLDWLSHHLLRLATRLHAVLQVRRNVVHELLRGEAAGAGEVARALAVAEGLVHSLAAVGGERDDRVLVARLEASRMFHGAQEGDHHAERIHGGVLAAQVHVPEVGHGAVRGLELLDEAAVRGLAHQVGGDEARAAVHLRHLIREHVTIVVVAGHAKAASSPTDNLHGGRVADEVHELAARLVEEAGLRKDGLVLGVKDLLHLLPEPLLPLEDRLLRDHVGHDVGLQAALEEDVRQVLDVVERVVVDHNGSLLVFAFAGIHNDRLRLDVLREEGRQHPALTNALPARAVLATNGVALKEDWPREAQLDARDVDGVTGDGDAIPASAHGAVRRAEGLLQVELLHLLGRRRDGGLLEDSTDLRARGHSVMQDLVIGVVTRVAAQVEVLPVLRVHEGLNPFLSDDLHRIP
mmetsp:Transcript_118834/g.165572  ORF Transcript_118834/g.165572 Transcript_118834/m.165572 type:complete len:524 (+) Transcript_118834:172-1743(+)